MINYTLINTLKELVVKEKSLKKYKLKLRIKGKLQEKKFTKKENISLKIKKDEVIYSVIVLKTHKERFDLANKIFENRSIYVEAISKLKINICTKIKILEKSIPEGKQTKLI